ncbi:Uncharacterised protein [Chlamydia trachomatis]|nr:Uncharacterised protein [Chlamydia trachomatis]
MLAKRPVHVRIIRRDVQVVTVQMRDGDHLLPSIDQRIGYPHVQHRVFDAVVTRHHHDHALVRRKR